MVLLSFSNHRGRDSEASGMRNKFGFEICPKCGRELPEDKDGNIGRCLKCTNPFELEAIK